MRHCVYPFNGTKETRRTLVCNVDVDYNPVSSELDRGKTNDTKNANDGNLMLPQLQTLSLHLNNVK